MSKPGLPKRARASSAPKNGCSSASAMRNSCPRLGGYARKPSFGARPEAFWKRACRSRRAASRASSSRASPSASARTMRRSATSARLRKPVSRSDPVAWLEKVAVEPGFRRAGGGLPVVAPLGARRQRHQDRLGAAARLQAEQRAAVVHQVELDVTAAAIRLEAALALAVGQLLAALEDRHIGL